METVMRITYFVADAGNGRNHQGDVSLAVDSAGERAASSYAVETFSSFDDLQREDLWAESVEEGHSGAPLCLIDGDLVRVTEQTGETITREGIYRFAERKLFVVYERDFALVDYRRNAALLLWNEVTA